MGFIEHFRKLGGVKCVVQSPHCSAQTVSIEAAACTNFGVENCAHLAQGGVVHAPEEHEELMEGDALLHTRIIAVAQQLDLVQQITNVFDGMGPKHVPQRRWQGSGAELRREHVRAGRRRRCPRNSRAENGLRGVDLLPCEALRYAVDCYEPRHVLEAQGFAALEAGIGEHFVDDGPRWLNPQFPEHEQQGILRKRTRRRHVPGCNSLLGVCIGKVAAAAMAVPRECLTHTDVLVPGVSFDDFCDLIEIEGLEGGNTLRDVLENNFRHAYVAQVCEDLVEVRPSHFPILSGLEQTENSLHALDLLRREAVVGVTTAPEHLVDAAATLHTEIRRLALKAAIWHRTSHRSELLAAIVEFVGRDHGLAILELIGVERNRPSV
mmetsp:Transcript_120243/g.345650  ORF Transcript_120243/g.345650 Transcript_120243/m.345650 type:complete len:379 (-) Transcript_120243:63-1199(-)